MRATQPIVLVITPETILDVYLEYGMSQSLYDELSAKMGDSAKEALYYLTISGLDKLNGKMPLSEALYLIMLALVKASKEYEIDRNKSIDNN